MRVAVGTLVKFEGKSWGPQMGLKGLPSVGCGEAKKTFM